MLQGLRWMPAWLGINVMVLTWNCVGGGLHQAAAQTVIGVDCDAGQTLSDALLTAIPGDTLLISGTCMERVVVTTDRLTLDGQGSALIDGGGAAPENVTEGVVTIKGAQGVILTGITVQNGPDGIIGTQGAAFEVRHSISQDNADEGLQVDESSTARMRDCILQRNAGEGLNVLRTSSVTFSGIVVSQHNGGTGFAISNGSSAFVNIRLAPHNVTLQAIHNGHNGFFVNGASSASLTETTLEFIPIKSWVATGSGAPGSCAGHN